MTRVIVYITTLVASVAASILSVTSIILPRWIAREVTTPAGDHIRYTYGLHRRCSSIKGSCVHFPQRGDCYGDDRTFCSIWRSIGFLMSFAVLLEGMILVAYLVVMAGGREKREKGWKIMSLVLVMVAVVQCASMALVSYLNDTDPRFSKDWELDTSWILCSVSWIICAAVAAVLCLSALLLPSEGGYELIPDHQRRRGRYVG